jgi:alkaline phosphatase
LSFEKLPYLALSKTYSVDQQTPDSAPTMTAMVTGVKTIGDSLSVNQNAPHSALAIADADKLSTILEQAKEHGLSAGVVSTARITHAIPAATYAHTANRDWEADSEIRSPLSTRMKTCSKSCSFWSQVILINLNRAYLTI